MTTFKEFLNDSIYGNIEDKARKAALASKDGSVKHDGKEYFLKFNQREWVYYVTDSEGDNVVNLNVKGLSKAKKELLTWLTN